MPNTIQILNKAWEGVDPAMVTDEPPKFSFEYFPPKTEKGIENLYNKVYRMSRQNPLFLDLTWGAGGSTSELTMQMSKNFKKMFNCEVNMHLTCTNITESSVKDALVEAKEGDITSICALRGDPPVGQDKWAATDGGFNCALDLVKFIKSEYGDFFSLAVAGYPEGHPNAITEVTDVEALSETEKSRLIKLADGKLMVCTDKSFKTELDYLKAKVDAGANLILTQLFYDVDVFLAFVKACREMGIKCPILPGIMPLATYQGFKRMTGFCRTRIPDEVAEEMEAVKDDDAEFKKYGIELVVRMCKRIWATGTVPALHFYCLNQYDTVFKILTALGIEINKLDSEEERAAIDKVKELVKQTLKEEKEGKEEKKQA